MLHPFEAYKKFLALTRHFNTDYDYFKYQGKIRCSEESFERRKDKYFFDKLARKSDLVGYIVANVVSRNPKWIGDFFGEEADTAFLEQQKRIQSLSYIFIEELKKINFSQEHVKVYEGQHPKLLVDFLQKTISMETLVLLDDIIGFTSYWNKKIIDTIIWPEVFKKMKKYQPFISYNKEKIQKLLVDYFQNK
jgi:hypothetical protein